MGVDAGVAGGAREILVLPIGNVLVGARISELFGQSKIYHITQVALVLKEVYQLYKSYLYYTFFPRPIRKLSGFISR